MMEIANILTNAGVPSEDISVKYVERKVSEASWYFTVEVFSIERTARKKERGGFIGSQTRREERKQSETNRERRAMMQTGIKKNAVVVMASCNGNNRNKNRIKIVWAIPNRYCFSLHRVSKIGSSMSCLCQCHKYSVHICLMMFC